MNNVNFNDIAAALAAPLHSARAESSTNSGALSAIEQPIVIAGPTIHFESAETELIKNVFENTKLPDSMPLNLVLLYDLLQCMISYSTLLLDEDWTALITDFKRSAANMLCGNNDLTNLKDYLASLVSRMTKGFAARNQKSLASARSEKEERDYIQKQNANFLNMSKLLKPRIGLLITCLKVASPVSLFLPDEKRASEGASVVTRTQLKQIFDSLVNFISMAYAISPSQGFVDLREHLKAIEGDFHASHLQVPGIRATIEQLTSNFPWVKQFGNSVLALISNISRSEAKFDGVHFEQRLLEGNTQRFVDIFSTNASDPLHTLKVIGAVPRDIFLDQEEIEQLESLFEKYPLDSECTLFDLLLFAFIDALETLEDHVPKDKVTVLRYVRNQVGISFYYLFIGFARDLRSPEIAPNQASDIFFIDKDRFLSRLREFLGYLDLLLDSLEESTIRPTAATAKLHQKRRLQFKRALAPLEAFTIKIVRRNEYRALLNYSLSNYGVRADRLDRDANEGADLVKKMWRYHREIQVFSREKGLALHMIDFTVIPTFEPKNERRQIQFENGIVEVLTTLRKEFAKLTLELSRAKEGQLTNAAWAAARKLDVVKPKTQVEFLELLMFHMVSVTLGEALVQDHLRLVQKRLYPPGFVSLYNCFYRLKHNLEVFKPLDKLNTKFSHVESVYADLCSYFSSEEFAQVKALIQSDAQSQTAFRLGFWHHILTPIRRELQKQHEATLAALKKMPSILLNQVRESLGGLSYQELLDFDMPAFKKDLFESGVAILRPLMILSDMRAMLFEVRYHEPEAIIPVELAEIMELDGLDELLAEQIAAKKPAPPAKVSPPEVPPQMPIPSAPLLEPAAPQAPTFESDFKEKKSSSKSESQSVSARQAQTAVSSTSDELKAFLRLSKPRKILAILEKEYNFFKVRQKGSHITLRGPEGQQVTVSDHKDIPTRTVRSIAEQAGLLNAD